VITVTETVPDPVAAKLIRMIAKRSREGAVEYKSDSILERGLSGNTLLEEASEEAVDLAIYLLAAMAMFSTPRGGD